MSRQYLLLIATLPFFACSSGKKNSWKNGSFPDLSKQKPTYEHLFFSGYHNLLNETTFLLDSISMDDTYGYTKENPIMVGGNSESGAYNQRRFLNALLGPNGETVTYRRIGSCCGFVSPSGIMGGGLLDRYEVIVDGGKTLELFLNFYDRGVLKAPKGLTYKK